MIEVSKHLALEDCGDERIRLSENTWLYHAMADEIAGGSQHTVKWPCLWAAKANNLSPKGVRDAIAPPPVRRKELPGSQQQGKNDEKVGRANDMTGRCSQSHCILREGWGRSG